MSDELTIIIQEENLTERGTCDNIKYAIMIYVILQQIVTNTVKVMIRSKLHKTNQQIEGGNPEEYLMKYIRGTRI
jgi:hypothetical protein